MDPTTGIAIAVSVAALAGFGAGWGLKPDAAVKALEAQTEAIETLNRGNAHLVAEVNAVARLDAEREFSIADKLTNVPPQCVPELGGDPMSPECAWAWCIRTGETDKQRCEVGKLQDYLIVRFKAQDVSCPDGPAPLTEP